MKRTTFLNRLNPFARRAARSASRGTPLFRRRLSFEGLGLKGRSLSVEPLESRMLLSVSVFEVTNTNDSGDGSLRQAILDANAHANDVTGPDEIVFNINAGEQTISLGDSNLFINDTVIIDGSTQPGFSGTPLITIDADAVTGSAAMVLQAGVGSQLRNFRISNAPANAISLFSSTKDNILENLDLSGDGNGIWIYKSDGNTICETTISVGGNVVKTYDANGNTVELCDLTTPGIGINLSGNDNRVQYNDASNVGGAGVLVSGTGNRIIRNDFSKTEISSHPGISATYGMDDDAQSIEDWLVVRDNIFTNVTAVALTDLRDIALVPGADFNIDVRDAWCGLSLTDISNVTIDGFDLSGDGTRWPQQDRGLVISGINNTNITVTNIIARDRNVGISASLIDSEISSADLSWTGATPTGYGLKIYGRSNTIQDLSVTDRVDGIWVYACQDTTIRNSQLFDNSRSGVYVHGDTSGIGIQANSIHSNGLLGIDLAPTGVTENDAGDVDTGPNNLQNFPVLSGVGGGAATRVEGSLNSTSNTEFTLDFYASTTADPSGYGEGERWLAAITVTTDENGDASFDEILSAMTIPGEIITATATEDLPEIVVDPGTPDDPTDDYTIHPGNTSEFSAGVTVQGSMVEIDVKPGSDPNAVNLNSNGVIAVAILADANFDPSCVQVDTVVFADAYAAQYGFEDVDADGDTDLVMHFRIEDTNLEEIYRQLLEDDQNADGVLDSTRQEVHAWLFGQTTGDELFAGVDEMDVFLSGKHLRELLDELFGAGTP